MVKNKSIRKVLLFLFASVFLLSAYMVFSNIYESRRNEDVFDELESLLAETTNILESAEEDIMTKFADIYEKNPDIFGWISIEGTDLSYPVMHTPEEPEYYLHRAFDKSDSQSGVPFLAGTCTETCGNYLIYGHNMKNGSMFAHLLDYGDEEFWREHRIIQFDTLYGAGNYRVVAAFYSEVYGQSDRDVFRYYQYTDLTRSDIFDEYIQQVYRSALYDTGVTAEYGDQLLTLSTCSYHKKNGRFVVVAVKEK